MTETEIKINNILKEVLETQREFFKTLRNWNEKHIDNNEPCNLKIEALKLENNMKNTLYNIQFAIDSIVRATNYNTSMYTTELLALQNIYHLYDEHLNEFLEISGRLK